MARAIEFRQVDKWLGKLHARAVVYWVCTYSMSRYARYLEKRLGPA